MWTTLCGLHYVGFTMWTTLWTTLYGPHYVDHTMWTSLWTTLCGPYYVDHTMWTTLCGPHYVDHTMWTTLCGLHCGLHYEDYTMWTSQWTTLWTSQLNSLHVLHYGRRHYVDYTLSNFDATVSQFKSCPGLVHGLRKWGAGAEVGVGSTQRRGIRTRVFLWPFYL